MWYDGFTHSRPGHKMFLDTDLIPHIEPHVWCFLKKTTTKINRERGLKHFWAKCDWPLSLNIGFNWGQTGQSRDKIDFTLLCGTTELNTQEFYWEKCALPFTRRHILRPRGAQKLCFRNMKGVQKIHLSTLVTMTHIKLSTLHLIFINRAENSEMLSSSTHKAESL